MATDIHRNRRYSSFPTYPASLRSRSAYTPAVSTAGRISAGEITHSPGNCITTRGPKIKSSHFTWCYVWWVD